MATGSDWMSAASFISMGGALSAQGFAGLAYVMGWTGATCCWPSSSAPISASSARIRFPISGRALWGNAARIIGVIAAVACSFTYLIAQVTGVGSSSPASSGSISMSASSSGFSGAVLLGARGMRSVTWTQVAQYIILIVSYWYRWCTCPGRSSPSPSRADLRPAPPAKQRRAIQITKDAKEKETRALWKKDADEIADKIKAGNLPRPKSRSSRLAGPRAPAGHAPAASEDAKFSRYLTVPPASGCGTSSP
jgi:cation/acetate symporter